jgi:hypothetical protein
VFPVVARDISFALLALAAAATGCAPLDGEGEGDLEVTTGAYGESTCGTAPLNAGFSGGVSPAFVIGPTYGSPTCTGAAIIAIVNYSSNFVGAGDVPGGTWTEWADVVPTTQAACQAAAVYTAVSVLGSSQWNYCGQKVGFGHWIQIPGWTPFCSPPAVAWTASQSGECGLEAGKTYKFMYRAINGPLNGPTRKVRIESRPPVFVH